MKDQDTEGIWKCVTATIDGTALPEVVVNALRLTLTKDRYKTEKGDQTLFDSQYVADTNHEPPHIDITGTEGPMAGQTAQGIYAQAGDTLKMCYTMPGSPRPTDFESRAGSGAYFIVWSRQAQ